MASHLPNNSQVRNACPDPAHDILAQGLLSLKLDEGNVARI